MRSTPASWTMSPTGASRPLLRLPKNWSPAASRCHGQLDEATSTLKTVWNYQAKTSREYLERVVVGIRQGSRKLLDITAGTLREQAQEVRLRVKNRISAEQQTLFGRSVQLRASSQGNVQQTKEQLIARTQQISIKARFAVSRSTQILNNLKNRFDRERFLRRIRLEQDSLRRTGQQVKARFHGAYRLNMIQLTGLKDRFRLEKIRSRIIVERRSLADRQAILKAADPEQVLQRGFALMYLEDGQLIKSIRDIKEHDILRTQLADGTVVSEVLAREART